MADLLAHQVQLSQLRQWSKSRVALLVHRLTLLRTRKLRPTAATILGPQGPGKIARRQIQYKHKGLRDQTRRSLVFNLHQQRIQADVELDTMPFHWKRWSKARVTSAYPPLSLLQTRKLVTHCGNITWTTRSWQDSTAPDSIKTHWPPSKPWRPLLFNLQQEH